MMKNYRENPPQEIAGEKVVKIKDFKLLEQKKLENGKWVNEKIEMPLNATSNVLQYFTEGGLKVSVRPSGTEPKIKFYFYSRQETRDKALEVNAVIRDAVLEAIRKVD
jgi:phosphoglucomutase